MQGHIRGTDTCQGCHFSQSPGCCLDSLFVLNVIRSRTYKKVAVNCRGDKDTFSHLGGELEYGM